MNMKKIFRTVTLCTLVGAATLGCYDGLHSVDAEVASENQIISGKPISVAYDNGGYTTSGAFAAVVEIDGKYILASVGDQKSSRNRVEAAALIESEIKDNDNENIQLTGTYMGARFEIVRR
jgi:hypothetical protein